MQCFGGCFAPPVTDEHDAAAVKQAASTSSPFWSSSQQSISGASADGSSTTASERARLKSKLRLLSSKSSRSSSQAAAGPTYTPAGDTSREERARLQREHLLQHGRQILGISTLQQEQLHHFEMPGIGYIAFAWMQNGFESLGGKKTPVALSDPVCAPEHYRSMAEAFVREHPRAIFVQVSPEFAQVVQAMKFRCNSMGGETRLDLATYDFTGYARRGLRSAIQSAIKEGITVEEVMHPDAATFGAGAAKGAGAAAAAAAGTDWTQLSEALRAIDAKWAESKGGRANDVWFINRCPVFTAEAGVRKFVARNAAGELQGFIFFDGVFDQGNLTGYYANVTRLRPDAHPGTLNLIIKEFINKVRSEAQLSAPAKKLSMRKSLRKKLEAAAAAAVAAAAATADADSAAADTDAVADQQQKKTQLQAQLSLPQQQQAEQQATPAAAAAAGAGSGPKFLSLGLSPFYQMDNKGWKSCPVTHLLLLLSFADGAEFYPFKTLAAAKAKYGAGLHDGKYEDPSVEYRQAYMCHNRRGVYSPFWTMFDLAKLYGFWTGPVDCFGRYLDYKGKQGAALVVEVLKKAASLDTYKPSKQRKKNKSKKQQLKRSQSAASSSAGSSSSSKSSGSAAGAAAAAAAAAAGLARSKSAPAEVGAVGKKQQQKQGAKAATAATAAAAAAAAAGDGASVASLASSGRVQSEASLIAAGSNPPVSASTSERLSDSSSVSDSASGGNSSVGNASSHGSTRLSDSDSDNGSL